MERELKFSIDAVQYVMTPYNAMAAWNALKRAAALFKGVDIQDVKDSTGKDGKTSVAIGTLLSNLGEPSVAEIERIVFAGTAAKVDGAEAYRLSDKLDAHFNQYRTHLFKVLVEGVKYQYGDFFGGGMEALKEMGLFKKAPPSS